MLRALLAEKSNNIIRQKMFFRVLNRDNIENVLINCEPDALVPNLYETPYENYQKISKLLKED